jgi:hypothetical protein
MMVHTCNLVIREACVGGSWCKANPEQKGEALSEKQLKQNRAGGMAQVLEHLPSKPKTLSSHLRMTKNKKRKRNKIQVFCEFRKYAAFDILKCFIQILVLLTQKID